MFRHITQAESVRMSRKSFREMREGSLFDDAGDRYFIVVSKSGDVAEVIELTLENRANIVNGIPCVKTRITLEDNFVHNLLVR